MGFQLWQIVVLAIIQGLTEFLPVSSSGHLVIVGSLLSPTGDARGLKDLVDISIVLHVGTLASILVHYWRQILRLLGEDRRVIWLLIIGTLPAAVVGVILKRQFESVLSSPLLAGTMLLVTGALLLLSGRIPLGTSNYHRLPWHSALAIGFAQAAAILPGLSRSGSTVVAGLALEQTRASAATFSFLLAIPAIGGAATLEILDLWKESHVTTPLAYLAVGAIVSFVVGLLALRWLLRWLEHGRLPYFAAWCIPLGLLVLALELSGHHLSGEESPTMQTTPSAAAQRSAEPGFRQGSFLAQSMTDQ